MSMRGLTSSLGAGGSLIAAVLCAAALVGGIVAFRGHAGDVAAADAGDVTVPDATAAARAATTTVARVPTAAGAAPGARRGRAGRPGRARRRPARVTPPRGTTRTP